MGVKVGRKDWHLQGGREILVNLWRSRDKFQISFETTKTLNSDPGNIAQKFLKGDFYTRVSHLCR